MSDKKKVQEPEKEAPEVKAAEVEEVEAQGEEWDSSIQKKVEELEAQNKEYLGMVKRLQAEFDNYRKREAANRANLEQIALKGVLEGLLEIDDNFMHALNAEVSDVAAYKHGVEMIAKQLADFLKKYDVEKIESLNQPFDPTYHEAMMRVEEGEHSGDIVGQVFREGYMIGDKVLRTARVKVSSGSGSAAEENEAASKE